MKPFEINDAFRPAAVELRQRAVQGAGITLLSGGVGLAIQVIATVVLARLLTPADFGRVAMVTAFSQLFMNFGLNGLTEAVVQQDEVTHDQASSLFWINLGAGFLLTIGFAFAGSLLARFYHDPKVAHVAVGLSLTILLTSVSVLHLALLKRAMRFADVSFNDVYARIVSVIVSVVFGLAGWGYWALVLGTVALPLSTAIGAWFMCRWVPGRPRQIAATGSMIRFAIHIYGRFSLGYFTNNLDNFLVGWRLGPTPLGFYKKAYDLFALPSNQLSTRLTIVAVSALSRLRQDSGQYKRYFLGALGVMAFVGLGLSADLTLIGKDLILVLLGPKWAESGRIFTLFGPGIGFMLLYCTHVWLHISLGRADRWFRWGIVDLIVTTVFLLVGLRWHAEGIAVAWVASYWIITLPALWYAGRPIQLGISSVIAVIWRYVLASLIAGGATFLIARAIPSLGAGSGALWAFGRIVVVSALFAGVYLSTVISLHRGCAPLNRLAELFREMTSRGKFSRPVAGSEQVVHGFEGLQQEVLAATEISRRGLDEIAKV